MPDTIGSIVIGRPFAQIAPDAPLRDACRALCQYNVGALAVVADGALVGILSETDVILRAIFPSRPITELRVADVMRGNPTTVERDTPTTDALALMRARNIRHLPVVEGGQPVAMLSVHDVPTIDRLMVERYAECFDGVEAA